MNNFSDWTQEDFVAWLRENYPKPSKDRFVQFTLHVHHDPTTVFEAVMADDYEICIDELANELATHDPEERWDIIMKPAKRRQKKQMSLYRQK